MDDVFTEVSSLPTWQNLNFNWPGELYSLHPGDSGKFCPTQLAYGQRLSHGWQAVSVGPLYNLPWATLGGSVAPRQVTAGLSVL